MIAVASLTVYLAHGQHGSLTRDLSLYVYSGQRVLDGVPPYVDVLNRAGPLAQLVPAVGTALGRPFGFSDVVGARMLFMVFAIAAVVSVYFLCRMLLESRLAGVAGSAAMLSFHGFIQYASDGPREKTVMVLLFVLFLIDLHRRHWLRAGIWLSLATLTLQIIFPPGAAAAVVALLVAGRGLRLRALIRFAVGGLVPVIAFGVYFAAVGALHEAFESYWLINANYTRADPPLDNARVIWENITAAYGATLWVMFVGSAVLVMAGVFALVHLRDGHPTLGVRRSRTVAPAGAAVVLAVLWSLRDFDGWPDAFPLLPLAAVGIALLAVLVADRVPARVALAVVTVWIVAATANAAIYAVTTRSYELHMERAVTAAMDRHLPANATFFTVQAPQALALGHHVSISRNLMFLAGLRAYLDDTYPGGVDGFGRWVQRQQPTVILDESRYQVPSWLEPTLRNYWQVTEEPWRTFVSHSVGAQARDAIRQALTRAGAE